MQGLLDGFEQLLLPMDEDAEYIPLLSEEEEEDLKKINSNTCYKTKKNMGYL